MRDTRDTPGSDIVDQLARYGGAVEAAAVARQETAGSLPLPPARPGRRQVLLAAAGIVAVVGLGGAAIAAWDRSPDRGEPDVQAEGTGTDLAGGGTWATFPAAPIATRLGASMVVTGDELIVWGGWEQEGGYVATGAALSLADHTWRSLAPSPLSPRTDAVAVWTGDRMLVWGGRADGEPHFDGALYDPATDSWEALPARAWGAQPQWTGAAWTGEELVLAGIVAAPAATPVSDTFALDPATGEWRALSPSPFQGRPGVGVQAVWTGDEVLVVEAAPGGARAIVHRLDPSRNGHWDESVELDVAAGSDSVIEAAWAGDRLVVVERGPMMGRFEEPGPLHVVRSVLFDPVTGSVEELPPAPMPPTDRRAHEIPLTAVGDLVVEGAAVLDVRTRTWHAQAPMPGPAREWAMATTHGDQLYVWGGDQCDPLCGTGTDVNVRDPGPGLAWHR